MGPMAWQFPQQLQNTQQPWAGADFQEGGSSQYLVDANKRNRNRGGYGYGF